MQKIAISLILAVTFVTAGIFVLKPVEKVTTAHQAIQVTEQAKTKLYQFVDTPYDVTYSGFGEAFVRFEPPNSMVRVDGFRHICVEVLGTPKTTSFDLTMGKLSGATLGERIAENQVADAKIHCYNISGPEVGLVLRGTPNTTDKVQLWMYLRS